MLRQKSMLIGRGLFSISAVVQLRVRGASLLDHPISARSVLCDLPEKLPHGLANASDRTTTESASPLHVQRCRRRFGGTPSNSRQESGPSSPSQATRNAVATPRFEQLWWDRGSELRNAVSIWRPKPPPGYAVLGDCLVEGFEPPRFGIALREDGIGSVVAKPTKYVQRMSIRGTPAEDVYIWFPVAPKGYVAMGCLATKTKEMPPLDQMRCIRVDHVTQSSFSKWPLWRMSREERVNLSCDMGPHRVYYIHSLWEVENQAHTFIGATDLQQPPTGMAYSLAPNILAEKNQWIDELEPSKNMEYESEVWVTRNHPQIAEVNNRRVPPRNKIEQSESVPKNHPVRFVEGENQRAQRLEPSKANENGNHPQTTVKNNLTAHEGQKLEPSKTKENEIHPQSIGENNQRVHGREKHEPTKTSENGNHPQSVIQMNEMVVCVEMVNPSKNKQHESYAYIGTNHPRSTFDEKNQKQYGVRADHMLNGKYMKLAQTILSVCVGLLSINVLLRFRLLSFHRLLQILRKLP